MKNKPFKIFSIDDDNLTNAICHNSIFGGGGKGQIKTDKFSDGELSPQFMESIRDKTVFLVCSTTTPEKIIKLQLAIDAAKRASAYEIIVLAPYFGYSRQDRKEGIRGPIGAKVQARNLETTGMHRIITSDLHADQIVGFFDGPVDHIFGTAIFRQYREMLPKVSNYAIFSPDTGGAKRAEKTYKRMLDLYPETTFGLCHKTRDKPNSIEKMLIIGEVKGKKVILVDDMVDTAGTLVKSAELIMEAGAESVEAWITHPVLSGPAKQRINDCTALSRLVVSDSIYHADLPDKVKVVSGAPTFAKVIDRIVTRQSIDVINSE